MPQEPRHRRDVDNPPPSPLDHPRKEGAGAEKGPGDVDTEDLLPAGERHPVEGGGESHAGRLDEDVDGAQALGGGTREPFDRGLVGHVATLAPCLMPGRAEILRDALDLVDRARGDEDPRSGFGQCARHGGADPAAAAGHDRAATSKKGRRHGHPARASSTASATIPPKTATVSRPSSAVAAAGSPK